MYPNLSTSFLINQTPNINYFLKLLTLPNPTDIGHFNYVNQFFDAEKKFMFAHGLCQPKGPFHRHSDSSSFSILEKKQLGYGCQSFVKLRIANLVLFLEIG